MQKNYSENIKQKIFQSVQKYFWFNISIIIILSGLFSYLYPVAFFKSVIIFCIGEAIGLSKIKTTKENKSLIYKYALVFNGAMLLGVLVYEYIWSLPIEPIIN